MSWFGSWGREKARQSDVHERAFRRKGLAEWDAKWHALSPAARAAFVDTMKGPARNQADHAPTYTVPRDKIPPDALDELVAAGFAGILPARAKKSPDRVFARSALYDFAARVRMLGRHHLLGPALPGELQRYVEHAFIVFDLLELLSDALAKAGLGELLRLDKALERYVSSYRWPGWVSQALKDPIADRIVDAIKKADALIPFAKLPDHVPGVHPDKVRAAAEKLIARLVLFEDLDPATSDIVIGLLPAVREGLARSGRPAVRPPLVACEHPREYGPDDGPIVADLRAFLLEVSAEPPLLRKDGGLFQKEVERFQTALEPLPEWLHDLLQGSDETRLARAQAWAQTLRLVDDVNEGTQTRLRLTSKGQSWLASGPDAQYTDVYEIVNTIPSHRGGDSTSYWNLFPVGSSSYYGGFYGGYYDDARFLGNSLMVLRSARGKKPIPDFWEAKADDIKALRTALDQSLSTLKPGTFYRMESIPPHLAHGQHNPVNLGLPPEQVEVIQDDEPIPAMDEVREEAGRSLIKTFLRTRLIPLGCVQAAVDAEGKVCVARTPRLDAYFGRQVAAAEMAPAAQAAAKVVVQPDFSVIIVGLNPTAAAELTPFCERPPAARGSRGAVILKITRDSVIRAVANGLKSDEILGRLRRHASHEVPANVLHEVRAWSGWVRHVTSESLLVLRCPDRDTADRVMGALRRQGERLNDTLVAVVGKLAAAERTKLRAQGILVESGAASGAIRPKPKAKKKRRAW